MKTKFIFATSDVRSGEAGEAMPHLTILEMKKCKKNKTKKNTIKWLYLSSDVHFKGIFQLTSPVLKCFFLFKIAGFSTFTVQILRRDVW